MEHLSGQKSLIWWRVVCLTVTAAALFIVFRRVHPQALLQTLRHTHPGWFLAAIGLYGLLFLPAAWRWHLMLRLCGTAVHPGASLRVTLIGHLFYVLLFGAPAGDAAKSALYARWYRLPLPEVFAAVPLDRFLGFCGLLLFASLALGLAAMQGAFATLQQFSPRWPVVWVLLILALAVLAVTARGRWKSDSPWGRFIGTVRSSARQVLICPAIAAQGLACGFLVQVLISGTLALNLQAVSESRLLWSHLLWTFPIISAASALPITVAGLGVREGVALMLFGLYGIPAADAVAASLLSLSAGLVWMLVGAGVLWREGKVQQRSPQPMPQKISAVIPTLNEADSLRETVRRARAVPEVNEIIVVDGGSQDRTRELAAELGCRVLLTAPSRGTQLRRGAAEAAGDAVLLLHADTWLPPDAGRAAINCLRDPRVVAGGFWKVFRDGSPLLLGSRFKCAVRLYLGRRIAGDQAMFVRREALEAVGSVPDIPLMEDFELCRRLRKTGRLALGDATVITSARRFAKLGVLRTYLRMWWVTTRYRLGTPPQELARLYNRA